MNRKTVTAAIIAVLMIITAFAGCEMFQGPPVRDNLNDPDNELPFSFNLEFSNTLTSIGVSWNTEGEFPNNFSYELIYGTAEDMGGTENMKKEIDPSGHIIEDVVYGTEYNIWLRAFEEDYETTSFIKYGSAMPEAVGEIDPDFGTNGTYSLTWATGSMYDLISADDNSVFAAGEADGSNQAFVKLNPAGFLDTTFNGTGMFSIAPAVALSPVVCTQLSNGDFVSFIKTGIAEDLNYYRNESSENSTVHNFAAEGAVVIDGDNVIVGGANAPDRFSVIKFDQNIINTSLEEYSFDTGYPGDATGLDFADGRIYACGWVEDASFAKNMHAVILNPADMTVINTIAFNADWDSSNQRIRNVGTTGPIIGTKIAADPKENIYMAGVGILSKFRLNGDVVDMDSNWPDADDNSSGSIFFESNMCPVDVFAQPNGKIILIANYYEDMEGTVEPFIVAKSAIYRFNADGSPDSTFDGSGVMEFTGVKIIASDIKPDGHLVFSTNEGSSGRIYQIR